MLEVSADLTLVPCDQDRLDVREVLVQRRTSDTGLLGDLRHRHGSQPALGHQRGRGVEGCVANGASVRLDRLVPQFRHCSEYTRHSDLSQTLCLVNSRAAMTDLGSDRSTPRWVKVFAIIAVVLVVNTFTQRGV